jgi:hypothetical protein
MATHNASPYIPDSVEVAAMIAADPGTPPGILLTPGGAVYAAAAIPQFNIVQGTNFPVPQIGYAVNDLAYWNFPARAYTSGDITFTVYWYAAATSGNVQWAVSLGAITIGTDSGSIEAKALATATNGQTATNSNAKAGKTTAITITGSSLDSIAANDFAQISLKRIAASSSEMSGDALFLFAVVSWA